MTWLERNEQRFGHLAVPHLLRYVALLNALVFLLQNANPRFIQFLVLDPQKVMEGQVWRLLSHIFVPQIGTLFPPWIEAIFYLLFLNWLGNGLESAMGPFRLNLYYLLGLIGTTASAFIMGNGSGGFLLNNSLLFAFAWFYPGVTIYLLMIIPLRVKWLAWLDALFVFLYFLRPGWAHRVGVLASLANFAIFFGPSLIRSWKHRRAVAWKRQVFSEAADAEETLHRCEVCGLNEVTGKDLDFRVAKDGREYCQNHLPKIS